MSKLGTDAVTATMTVCVREPLVPVTLTRKIPAVEALTERVEVFVPV